MFEFVETPLDGVSCLVDVEIIGDWAFACWVAGNDGLRAHAGDNLA